MQAGSNSQENFPGLTTVPAVLHVMHWVWIASQLPETVDLGQLNHVMVTSSLSLIECAFVQMVQDGMLPGDSSTCTPHAGQDLAPSTSAPFCSLPANVKAHCSWQGLTMLCQQVAHTLAALPMIDRQRFLDVRYV